ncbi:MAG: MFS transporter [Anaerolineales bacterium]
MFSQLGARVRQFFTLPPDPKRPPEIAQHFARNFLANAGDMTTWLFGASFLSVSAILPVYASRLNDSPIFLGLIPALIDAGWFLPQLFFAPLLERLPRKLPLVMWLGAFERIPYALLPFMALWLPNLPQPWAVTVFLLIILWRALGSGLVAAPWQEMLAKIIPVTHRGRFFGIAHFAGQLVGIGGSAVAAWILAAWPYPQNFALSFGVGAVAIWASLAFIAFTVEPAIAPVTDQTVLSSVQLNRAYAQRLLRILQTNPNFRTYLLSRWLSYSGGMAAGFLAVYAVERFQLPDAVSATFTGLLFGAGVIGYALWGVAGDRYGHKRVMVIASALWVSALAVALASSALWGFYVVFALMGFSSAAGTLSDLNLAMEFGPEAERPTYIGLTRTVTGPALLIAPLAGGWLAQTFGYPVLFATSLAFALGGGLLLAGWVTEPRHSATAVIQG